MSKAKELVRRLMMERESDLPLDWRHVREDINEAHDAAETEADRVACLGLHKAIMDAVEDQGLVYEEKLEEFRKLRQQDYNRLLIKEAMIGVTDGLIRPDRMAAITRREVAAGRMADDDELHKLAVGEGTILTQPPRQEPRGIGKWIASWFK